MKAAMMTVQEFAAVTQRVIQRDGFDQYIPIVCYPERRQVRGLAGLPLDVDQETAVLEWARKAAKPGEEYLVAFKSGPSSFTVVRMHGEERESATFEVGNGSAKA